MKNILFVGEHPQGITGNSAMMAALLEQLDLTKYKPACFVSTSPKNRTNIFGTNTICDVIVASDTSSDLGASDLLNIVRLNPDLDVVIIVGVDVWRYALAFEHIYKLSQVRKFKTVCILPYDLPTARQDWAKWFSVFDFPYVYSEFGYKVLKPLVPALRYFRPPLHRSELFVPFGEKARLKARQKYFSQMSPDRFIFGFIGANQFRKDPQRALKAFFEVKRIYPNITLYLHTNMTAGVYNLQQIAMDYGVQYGARTGDVISKKPNYHYDRDAMIDVYNAIDCLLNTSTHEGLSWTLIEAMLCGTPVIASDNTAQSELIDDGAGHGIVCSELGYIPVITESGSSFVETKFCDFDELVAGMTKVIKYEKYREKLITRGRVKATTWLDGVSNINEVLEVAATSQPIQVTADKKEAILFVQHSSAGDVLMTTQCFKGIKEYHKGLPLVYMTQKVYQDIVVGNPYIDEIVDYDEAEIDRYSVVYNPHGDRILPGGFNNLDTRLHDMYPYFCDVKPDNMFIECVDPMLDPGFPEMGLLREDYIVIQTSGGEKMYRTYRHMDMLIQMFPDLQFVQLGSGLDMACQMAHLDLREKLTWRESAWVMKNAKAAVVIDSFLSHLAGVLGIPTVVLFGPAPARVTGPKGSSSRMIFLEPNKLDVCPVLTNCWGKGKEVNCESPCINTINPLVVAKELKKLLAPFGI